MTMMTMNMAGGIALALCLTATSGQPAATTVPQINLPTSTQLSFVTEENTNNITFERHVLDVVTAAYESTMENTIEAAMAEEAAVAEEAVMTEEIVEAAEEIEAVEEAEEVVKLYENRWGIQLTAEEIDLLAKIVWVEARGESEAGQRAVVEVVFNRMVSDKFPNNLYDVLSQKNPTQFASWKHRDSARPTEKEYASIYSVLNGESGILREDTLYFATKKLTRNLDVKIDGHYFCYK